MRQRGQSLLILAVLWLVTGMVATLSQRGIAEALRGDESTAPDRASVPEGVTRAPESEALVEAGVQSETTVILADPGDPYYVLAEEISSAEGIDVYHSCAEALRREPVFLLWVVSPKYLSDEVLVSFSYAMKELASPVSTGILTGSTLARARALWVRAGQARGERLVVANAENLAGHIKPEIVDIDGMRSERSALTRSGLVRSLQTADYLTFTGHGGASYLRLDEETTVRRTDLPALDAVVVATGSCNTLRPWEEGSIALAFVDRGAAAYAGFAYSPNEGFLFGEFDGLPFRYTWPEYPIGHVVQIQNRGAMQGFAAFPYYFLLGDPRIALQTAAPYQLTGSHSSGRTLTLEYEGAPAGVIPVRVPEGAGYPFVRIPGAGLAWQGEPFYNDRVQMIDIGEDKFVLFEHSGGPFQVQLYERTPWLQVAGDVVVDALDGTLLFFQDHSGALILTIAGILAFAPVTTLLVRRRASVGTLGVACAAGLIFGALHATYALARIDVVTMTSNRVILDPLSPASTFLLVTAGALYFLCARSWRGRALGVAVATLPALAPALFLITLLGALDNLIMRPQLGADLWNCRLGLQPLLVFLLSAPLLAGVFQVVGRGARTQIDRGQRRHLTHEAIAGDG